MATYKISPAFKFPVIDVAATAKQLKALRTRCNITVAQVQQMLGMENPQAIYSWESEKIKSLPCLDNLVALAKIYNVSIDELIVVTVERKDTMTVCEPCRPYGISQETLDFIARTAGSETKAAIEKYYGFSLQA